MHAVPGFGYHGRLRALRGRLCRHLSEQREREGSHAREVLPVLGFLQQQDQLQLHGQQLRVHSAHLQLPGGRRLRPQHPRILGRRRLRLRHHRYDLCMYTLCTERMYVYMYVCVVST